MAVQLWCICAEFCHFKGHQDKHKTKKKLSLPETFDCDTKAALHLTQSHQQSVPINPALAAAAPYLKIHGKLIVHEFKSMLQHPATMPNYHEYIRGWNYVR